MLVRGLLKIGGILMMCASAALAQSVVSAREAPQTVVFMGDSITQGWGQAHPAFFTRNRLDRGISGQTTGQMLARFQSDVVNARPTAVHILAGTNDIAGNGGPTTLQAIEDNIRSMADLATAHHIKVILGTILPTVRYPWPPEIKPVLQIKALNDWIRSYARKNGFCLADDYSAMNDGAGGLSKDDSSDGVHPTAPGYEKMERIAVPAINCALAR